MDSEPPPDEEEDEEEPEEAGSSSIIKPETFQIKGAKIEALRAAFERREWQEAEEDQRVGLLWTIKAKITDALLDSGGARPKMLLNHYQRAWSLITKHRLAENIRALPSFEDVDVDTVAPPTYYVKDIGMLRELLSDFCLSIAQRVLRAAASDGDEAASGTGGAMVEHQLKVRAAIAIARRFLDRVHAARAELLAGGAQSPAAAGKGGNGDATLRKSFDLSSLPSQRHEPPQPSSSLESKSLTLGQAAGAPIASGSAIRAAQAKRALGKKLMAAATATTANAAATNNPSSSSNSPAAAAPSASEPSHHGPSSLAFLARSTARRCVEPLVANEAEWYALIGLHSNTTTTTSSGAGSSAASAASTSRASAKPYNGNRVRAPNQPPVVTPPASPPGGDAPHDGEENPAVLPFWMLAAEGDSESASSEYDDSEPLITPCGEDETPPDEPLPSSTFSVPHHYHPDHYQTSFERGSPPAEAIVVASQNTRRGGGGGGMNRKAAAEPPPMPPAVEARALLNELAAVLPSSAAQQQLGGASAIDSEATVDISDGGGPCAWILKSVDMSRGRGISISADLHAILRKAAHKEYRLIVQKYIERPLLIHSRKFDIRQWVLVTSVNPLVIWMYSNYYLRFSSREYTGTNDLDNAEVHLTNQSVQKHSEEYGVGPIESNMWSKQQFQEYLAGTLDGGEEAAQAAIHAIDLRMRRAVGVALRATCDIMEPRRNSFELFGFDFLLDCSHNVWLLEANSSPDMSTNAAPLRQIVDDGLEDLLNVVLELKRSRTPVSKLAAERKTAEGPRWRLAHHGKLLSEREMQKRRRAKKAGEDAPQGGAALFQGLSHQSALRPWVERLGAGGP